MGGTREAGCALDGGAADVLGLSGAGLACAEG